VDIFGQYFSALLWRWFQLSRENYSNFSRRITYLLGKKMIYTGKINIFKLFQDLLLYNKINNNAANLSFIFHVFHHPTLNRNRRNQCRNLILETWLLNSENELIWQSSPSKCIENNYSLLYIAEKTKAEY
jgi:hypothetical protein